MTDDTPIYGAGDPGFGDVKRRRIMVLQPLADRSENTPMERNMLLEGDMREAMALAAVRLDNEARKYRVTGYTWDLEDIEYDIASVGVVVGALVLERE